MQVSFLVHNGSYTVIPQCATRNHPTACSNTRPPIKPIKRNLVPIIQPVHYLNPQLRLGSRVPDFTTLHWGTVPERTHSEIVVYRLGSSLH